MYYEFRNMITTGVMAKKLGITESAWSLVKRGLRQPGQKVITGAVRGFPKVNVTKLLKEA